MPAQFQETISHPHLSSSSSFTTFIQRPNTLPYPPLTFIKHPLWFLNNADLFLRGTIPTFPISCNDISQTTLLTFFLLRYHPRSFTTSAWKSSLGTAKRPGLDWTQTGQDRKLPRSSKTVYAVQSSVSPDFGHF